MMIKIAVFNPEGGGVPEGSTRGGGGVPSRVYVCAPSLYQ